MRRCLEMMVVEGIKTNIPLHRRILDDPDFLAGRFDTSFMERFLAPKKADRGVVSGGLRRPPARGGPGGCPPCSSPSPCSPTWRPACPLRTYYFRDFTATFYPLRLFAARELREGGFPFWNPFVFEGSFQLPVLYPPDLLHALWPSPVFVSWLLTLHLPLAALAAYWLARELGVSREGAFVGGALYALGGLRPLVAEPLRVPPGAGPGPARRRGAAARGARGRPGGRLRPRARWPSA